MKKLTAIVISLALLSVGCKKSMVNPKVELEEETLKSGLICGADHSAVPVGLQNRRPLVESQAQQLLILLDFDGAIVRPGFSTSPGVVASNLIGSTRFCPAPSLTPDEIDDVVRRVKDDFSPFNIQVTTDQSVYDAYPSQLRMSCIFSTLPAVMGQAANVHGVAPFTGNFIASQPCFVFGTAISNFYGGDIKVQVIASTASQELGHLLGLSHQSVYNVNCEFITEYHPGVGSGPLGFAPIMGLGHKRITTWWAQPCSVQNDFNFINAIVALRPDDFPDAPDDRTFNLDRNISGTLGIAGDVDFIYIRPGAPVPLSVTSENIDLKVSVYTPGGTLIESYDDPADTWVTVPQVVGACFLKIEAVSNANLASEFMTGNYQVTY